MDYIAKIQEQIKSGMYDEALMISLQARKETPDDPNVWIYSATVYRQLGDPEKTIECCNRLVKLMPDSADAYFNLGVAYTEANNTADAEPAFLKAVELDPEDGIAYFRLACLLQDKGNISGAIDAYRSALKHKPDLVDARKHLASLYIQQGNHKSAMQVIDADDNRNNNAEFNLIRANIFEEQEQYEEAMSCYKRELQSSDKDRKSYAHLRIGTLFLAKGEFQSALDNYQSVLQVDKENIGARAGMASVYERMGDVNRAHKILKPYLVSNNKTLDVLLVFSRLCKEFGQCGRVIDALLEMLEKHRLSTAHERAIHFSLGKLYDDGCDYELAFSHYRAGNDLKRSSFSAVNNRGSIDALIQVFSKDKLDSISRSKKTNKNLRPVFIVGMPRSGTSLVEQILAAHPEVEGGGELDEIPAIVRSLPVEMGIDIEYPGCVGQLTDNVLNRMTRRYINRLKEIQKGKVRIVTDKLPGNFLHLGLIELLLPKARVIHCVRDPLDTCLSCYFTDFGAPQHFAYNLSSLGSFYCEYNRLMQHWKSVLKIPVYELRYEDLLSDPGKEIHELLEFCRLKWDEKCLNFHKLKRYVITASYNQATKPLYRSSIGKAQNYRKYLVELEKELRCL